MLQIAASWLEQETKDIEAAKEAYMAEKCPTPDLSGEQAALIVREKYTYEKKGSSHFCEEKY